jgi:hypothetical protein
MLGNYQKSHQITDGYHGGSIWQITVILKNQRTSFDI